MSANRSDAAEGNDRQHQQRLDVRFELDRQQQVHADDHKHETVQHAQHRLVRLLALAAPADGDFGKLGLQLGEETGLQVAADIEGVGGILIDVGADRDRSLLVNAANDRRTAPDLDIDQLGERSLNAIRSAMPELSEVSQRATLLARVADSEFHFVAAALQTHRFFTVVRGPDGA